MKRLLRDVGFFKMKLDRFHDNISDCKNDFNNPGVTEVLHDLDASLGVMQSDITKLMELIKKDKGLLDIEEDT